MIKRLADRPTETKQGQIRDLNAAIVVSDRGLLLYESIEPVHLAMIALRRHEKRMDIESRITTHENTIETTLVVWRRRCP